MKWLLVLSCFWKLAAALSYPESPPEVLPVPAVGLFTGVVHNLMAPKYAAASQMISELQQKINLQFINFLRENAGPGFNRCAKMEFAQRNSNEFWQSFIDITSDLIWEKTLAFRAARAIMEKQFSLVIDQPQVRSWLREARDLSRVLKNRTLERIHVRRAQWERLIGQTFADVDRLVHSELCHNPDALKERAERLIRILLEELDNIINALKQDISVIQLNTMARGSTLANNIYEYEVKALKYFVS